MASQKVTASLQDDKGTWTVRGRVYAPATGKMKQRTRSTGLKVKNNTKRKAEAMMKKIIEQWQAEAEGVERSVSPRSLRTSNVLWTGKQQSEERQIR